MNFNEILFNKIEGESLWEKRISLARNEYLKVKGTIHRNSYFVNEGSLRVFVLGEEEEHTIRFGYKNNFIASLDSWITGQPSDLYMQAIKKTELSVISHNSLMALINSSIENLNIWHNILQQLIVQQLEREIDILTTSPALRYKRVLLRSPQLFQEIPHKYIASYLRMTPETLSRLKKP